MNKPLTFNLNDIHKNKYESVDIFRIIKSYEDKIVLNNNDYLQTLISSWTTNSKILRTFIQDVFGIDFQIGSDHYSHNRNQLNSMIKKYKYEPTSRGKCSTLNFYEYSNLITSPEFNSFIINNLDSSKNPDKMYEELMYLQINRYPTTSLYRKNKTLEYITISNILSLLPQIDDIIKELYILYLKVHDNKINRESIPENIKLLLDVINYRFNQQKTIYKYDSVEDVLTTKSAKIIEHFLTDINRWANEITDGSLG